MFCDNCETATDSRIGLTLRGPFVCQECFRDREFLSLYSNFTLDGKKVIRRPDITGPDACPVCHGTDKYCIMCNGQSTPD
jgi:hypothetical protein